MALQRSCIAAWHVLNAVFTGVSEAELKTGRGRVSAAFKLVIYAASVCYFAWYNVAAVAVFTENRSNQYTQYAQSLVVDASWGDANGIEQSFLRIANWDDVLGWVERVLVPSFFRDPTLISAAGGLMAEREWLFDNKNVLDFIVIRQVRTAIRNADHKPSTERRTPTARTTHGLELVFDSIDPRKDEPYAGEFATYSMASYTQELYLFSEMDNKVCGLCIPAAVVGANDGGTDENATDVPRRQDDLIGLHLEDDVGGKHVRLKQCFADEPACLEAAARVVQDLADSAAECEEPEAAGGENLTCWAGDRMSSYLAVYRCATDPHLLRYWSKWVDEHTRALIVEIGLSNGPASDSLEDTHADGTETHLRLVIEQNAAGVLAPTFSCSAVSEHTIRRLEAAYAVFVFWTVMHGLEELIELFLSPRDYFLDSGNVLDFLHISLMLFICLQGLRASQAHAELSELHHLEWIDQFIVFIAEYEKVNFAIAAEFLYVWIKLLRLLSFLKPVGLCVDTLIAEGRDLVGFLLVIVLVVFGFAGFFCMHFGVLLFPFRSLTSSFLAVMNMISGDFDTSVFAGSQYRNTGTILTGLFGLLMAFIILNVFIAIISKAFETSWEKGSESETYFNLIRKLPQSGAAAAVIPEDSVGFADAAAKLEAGGVPSLGGDKAEERYSS